MNIDEWLMNEFGGTDPENFLSVDTRQLKKMSMRLRKRCVTESRSIDDQDQGFRCALRRLGAVESIKSLNRVVDILMRFHSDDPEIRIDPFLTTLQSPREEAEAIREDLEFMLRDWGLTEQEMRSIQKSTGIPIFNEGLYDVALKSAIAANKFTIS